jgi:hypothetical protein
MRSKATILAESDLTTIRVIEGINTFVLPILNFLLRHSNLSLSKLTELDTYLRKLINKTISSQPLIKEVFCIIVKDSGFGMNHRMTDITYAK